MKQIRRLGADAPADAYRKAQRGALRRMPLSEPAFRELERSRPECIVVDSDAVLVAEPRPGRVDLQYAFPDQASFVSRFPPMLGRLAGLFDVAEASFGMFLRLTDRAQRPYVEPVLFEQAFEVSREWMRMELAELPTSGSTRDAVASGFRLRPAQPDDAEAIVQLDAIAFPAPQGTVETVTSDIRRDHMSVLEDESNGRAAGFLQVHTHYTPAGYVSNIALHPDYQRCGLGEALMRWALAWFHEQGMRKAALTTNTDNARAIALYKKLGFRTSEIGIDYRRPIDEDEVRQVLERSRAAHITVRRSFS